MNKKHLVNLMALLIVISFVAAACTPTPSIQPPTQTSAPETQQPATPSSPTATPGQVDSNVYPAGFASYPAIKVSLPGTYAGDYSLPLDLAAYANLSDFGLTDTQKQALTKNGFVVTPPISDPNKMFMEFYQAYESIRYEETPLFVTTDSIFHVYHLIFDKMLRDLERQKFIPMLIELTTSLVKESQVQYDALKGTALEDQALRNLSYFLVAASLLKTDDNVPAEAEGFVSAELALIECPRR